MKNTEYQSDLLAFDFALSKRRKTKEGFLLVEDNRFIKEQVSPYAGREIPGWEDLGLDPDKIYYGYRPASEIIKSIKSWDGLPLLLDHAFESASNPTRQRIGSVGTSSRWDDPFGYNSFSFDEQWGIDAVESGEFKQISPSYRYRPEFVSGVFNGERYDFIMRDLEGNHIAIVQRARGGPDLVVNDSLPMEIKTMDEEKREEMQSDVEELEVAASKVIEKAAEIIEGVHEERDGDERDITDDAMSLRDMLRNLDYLDDDTREKLEADMRLYRERERRADDEKVKKVTRVARDEEVKEVEKEKIKIDDRADDKKSVMREEKRITAEDTERILQFAMRQNAEKERLATRMKDVVPGFACDSLTLAETAIKARDALKIRCRDSVALDAVNAFLQGTIVSKEVSKIRVAMDAKPAAVSGIKSIVEKAARGE